MAKKVAFSQVELAYFTKLFKLEGQKITRPTSVTYQNGDIYRGELSIKGNKHGLGIMFYANGNILQARWANNQANGSGYLVSPEGTEMIGIWKNNLLQGKKNKIRFASGTEYKGNTECGKIRGQGAMKYSCGDVYEGTWVNNELNGYADIKYQDGNTYQGFMLNHERCGLGIYTWSNGNKYTGNWYKDEVHGDGILDAVNTHGKEIQGPWALGQQLDIGNEF